MMLFQPWLRNRKRTAPAPRSAGCRLRLEGLEDRTLLTTYTASSVRSLIADINAANMAGGSNTIILAPGATFDLKSVNNTTNGANGLPVIGGTKAGDLTIVGNGDTVERVGGFTYTRRGAPSNPFRLIDVAPGAALTLQGVRLQGGWANSSGAAGDGGVIYNQGTLTVSNGTLSGNNAQDGGGGGIYNAGGTVTVSNSTLSNNSATRGGGVENSGGTVTVSNSTLSGNQAFDSGGGIYNSGGTVTVSNSLLSSNSARFGGGIYNTGGMVTVSNGSTLSGNSAIHADYPWTLGDGGGIYNWGGTVTIDNSTLSGNTGDAGMGSGGGIFNNGGGKVTVKNNSRITGNTASVGGDVYNLGMLYLDSTSTIGILIGNPAIPI